MWVAELYILNTDKNGTPWATPGLLQDCFIFYHLNKGIYILSTKYHTIISACYHVSILSFI